MMGQIPKGEIMRRLSLSFLVLGCLLTICFPSAAVDVEEIGVQVRLMHDPFLFDEGLKLAAAVSGYCKLGMAEGWTMRVELGNPLDVWLPWIGIASSHAIGDRWTAEVQLSAQGDIFYSLYLTLNAGVRALLAGSDRSRLMLASFPLSLAGLWYFDPSDFILIPSISANAALDFAWAASDHLVLGQSIGLSVVRLGDLFDETAFSLGDGFNLMLDARTRAAYRP